MISFQNVGYKVYETRKLINPEVSQTPVGILTPLVIDENGNTFFETTTSVEEVIKDNLRNLIQTNHGERLGRYYFGANLKPLAIEYTSDQNFDGEAMARINTAVRDYMPYINLEGYNSKATRAVNQSVAQVEVIIQFSVPKINLYNGVIKAIIYVS
jgi:phage baseplate assembly protein W